MLPNLAINAPAAAVVVAVVDDDAGNCHKTIFKKAKKRWKKNSFLATKGVINLIAEEQTGDGASKQAAPAPA